MGARGRRGIRDRGRSRSAARRTFPRRPGGMMGVEYAHGLFVVELSWKPTWAHVGKIHDVMMAWKLATKKPGYVELGDAKPKKLKEAAVAKAMPANLRLDYGEVRGAPVESLFGESQYDIDTDDRYIQDVCVVLGVNFQVLSAETYDIAVKTPPKNGKTEVTSDPFVSSARGSQQYPATWTTTPPTTTRPPGKFTGVWRSGVILDCGKDLSMISEEFDPLPATKFRSALEKAFGTPLVEQGWIY